MRILLENHYPNPAFNGDFDHTYNDEKDGKDVAEDFTFLVECVRDYEQIQLNRLSKEVLSSTQRDIIHSKLKEIDRINKKYSALIDFLYDQAYNTL